MLNHRVSTCRGADSYSDTELGFSPPRIERERKRDYLPPREGWCCSQWWQPSPWGCKGVHREPGSRGPLHWDRWGRGREAGVRASELWWQHYTLCPLSGQFPIPDLLWPRAVPLACLSGNPPLPRLLPALNHPAGDATGTGRLAEALQPQIRWAINQSTTGPLLRTALWELSPTAVPALGWGTGQNNLRVCGKELAPWRSRAW